MNVLLKIIEELNNGALGWSAMVIAVLSLIQIAPIEINPWSFIARHIGRALNSEVTARLDNNDRMLEKIQSDVDTLRSQSDQDRAINARVRILRFNDELLSNKNHSKESFDQVLADIDEYEGYCSAHPEFKNNKTVMSISNIKTSYTERLKKHDFLT